MVTEALNVTLGGVALEAFGPIQWTIRAGVEPVQEVFEVLEETANQLLAGGSLEPKTLKISYADGHDETFEGLYVLSKSPGSRPDTVGILVSDLRWKWRRKLIKRSFNIRRRSGARRRLGPSGTPIEIAPVSADIDFQPWSLMVNAGGGGGGGGFFPVAGPDPGLQGGTGESALVPWTPRAALENIMQELSSGEGFQFPYEIPDDAIMSSSSFEMIDLADPGPEALQRLLSYVPATDLYVDRTGRVKFFNRLSGEEANEIAKGFPAYVAGQMPKLINFDAVRPSQVDVYFTPEIEVRFDAGGTTTTEGRWLRNVLPLPDPTLSVGGKVYIQGTWFPFSNELYNAWNTPTVGAPPPPDGVPPISDTVINQFWHMDKLVQMYTLLGDLNPYQVWAMRVQAILSHYRQTYQINRRWMDKMHSIRAYRVGILDPENGTRAPSQAYTDYCIRPNMRSRFLGPITGHKMGINVLGYNNLLVNAKAAPAFVELLDDEIGIIHLDYQLTPFGLVQQIIPSAVDNVPTADIANLNEPIFWSGAKISGGAPAMPALHSTHQVAVVITAAPAAPNDLRQMYKRSVTPDEVQNVPGVGVGPANGPPWQVWVGPQITARFMWSDSHAPAIEAAFGNGPQGQTIEQLLVNPDDVGAVAKAVAAEIYARFTNRYQGGMSTAVNQGIEPKGNLLEVIHSVSVDGLPATSLSLPSERARLDPFSILPASTRRIIMREVQP